MAFSRSFQCRHCGVAVSLDAPGTSHRNHCPACLWSRHLDRNAPGDRGATCSGGMEPIAVTVRGKGRWVLIHRCTDCGRLRLNRTAGDDNLLLLMRLAALPLTNPPLPFEALRAAAPQGQAADSRSGHATGQSSGAPSSGGPSSGGPSGGGPSGGGPSG